MSKMKFVQQVIVGCLLLFGIGFVLAQSGESQWSVDPAESLRVTELGGDQATPKVIPAANGNFYVAWFSNPDTQNYNVMMQHYDAAGNALWDENGLVISDNPSDSWITDYILTIDEESNAIIIFQDIRIGTNNLFAYKISPDGEFLWGEDGIVLSNNELFEVPSATTVSTTDDLTVAWFRDSEPSTIVMQKIATDGTLLWEENGLTVIEGTTTSPYIVSGGEDEIIVVYGVNSQSSTQVVSLYAQKLDRDGNPVWNESLPILLSENIPIFITPSLESDGQGGVFVGWNTTEGKSFVQHLDEDGNTLWGESGTSVANSDMNFQFRPVLGYSPVTQELFVIWNETGFDQSARGVNGQKISADGERMWGDSGINFVELNSASLSSITMNTTAENLAIFYLTQGGEVDDTEVRGVWVDRDGVMLNNNPIVISNTPSQKRNMSMAEIGDQHWVTVWSDGTVGTNDIFMQDVTTSSSE